MNIIFSRKGMDSSFANCPSPVLSNGHMVSLPIPENHPSLPRYADIPWQNHTLGSLLEPLSGGRYRATDHAHLDPDLSAAARPRQAGWRPAFGQTGAAEKHLRNHKVTEGDIFLFFGWFRQVEETGGTIRYIHGAPHLHALFGWLQIGDIHPVSNLFGNTPDWLQQHPHVTAGPYHPSLNTVYTATETLTVNGETLAPTGGGTFAQLHPARILTAGGHNRSTWQLPGWMHPTPGRKPLSYHEDPSRWHRQNDGTTLLNVASRGQEFVLDTADYPEALPWLRDLFGHP